MTQESGAVLLPRQQYYLIMRFKQGGQKHRVSLQSDPIVLCSLCHINYFPTVPQCLCQGYKNLTHPNQSVMHLYSLNITYNVPQVFFMTSLWSTGLNSLGECVAPNLSCSCLLGTRVRAGQPAYHTLLVAHCLQYYCCC